MPTVDDILKLLENGNWHDLKEIEKKTQLNDLKLINITKFLARYDFIKLDKERQKAKLDPSTQNFFKKIRKIEGKERRNSTKRLEGP